MKFHLALLCVLCAHALARDENNKAMRATATSWKDNNKAMRATATSWKDRWENLTTKRDSIFRPTPKENLLPDFSVVVMKEIPSRQSMMSSCPSTTNDHITVGVKRIQAKKGTEYVFLPINDDLQISCFENYNNTVLRASDLVSCCDAAAAGGYNSFRFHGGVCQGFTAWLSPIHSKCQGDGHEMGLYVAKEKLSKFTPRAPTFNKSSYLMLARIVVGVDNIVDDCPFSKTLKISTFSKTESTRLELVAWGYYNNFYLPELCDDNASAAKRTVNISIIDSDGSELVSVTEVLSSVVTGRHLTPSGLCVQYSATPLRDIWDAESSCHSAMSILPQGNTLPPFPDLLREIAGLQVGAADFWTDAWSIDYDDVWTWDYIGRPINMNLFNPESVAAAIFSEPAAIVNVTDGLMYVVDGNSQHTTVCFDAPYIYYPVY